MLREDKEGNDKQMECKNRYLYIEILRQVCPVRGHQHEKFHFFLLGAFDAMQIHSSVSIEKLKKLYEKDQMETPALFDRQPLFMYADQDMSDIEKEDGIFSRSGAYAARPLVLTLFQIDKIHAAGCENISEPDDLIKAFCTLIDEEMKRLGCEPGKLKYQVFWNLGESDLVAVFRPDTLKGLSVLLNGLRVKQYADVEPIRIISTCSHCAFPKPKEWGDWSENEKTDRLSGLLRTWITEEFKEDKRTEFITLVNTSAEHNHVGAAGRLLYGEWDYMYLHADNDTEKLVGFLQNNFLSLFQGTEKREEAFPFRIAYTIPSLFIEQEEGGKLPGGNGPESDSDWINGPSDSMEKLCEQVRQIFGEEKRGQELADSVTSFKASVTGLAKFLYRLKAGRFEEDLYIYVKPIFDRLSLITDNYTENINTLDFREDKAQINELVKEYIFNTSDLVEKLQHLFSVMAVSPHTFMETYGSNMRSLAASDKLLDAYQGIVCFLKKNFPDRVNGKETMREILVLPYRKAQSAHTLLYQQSSPMNRISYIQIDFTKMFDIRASVFMLLHECGHHLGNRLREERFGFFAKAVICMTFEWIGYGNYLYDPLDRFVSRTKKEFSRETLSRKVECIFCGTAGGLKDTFENEIRKAAGEGIRELGEYYGDGAIKRYKEVDPEHAFLGVLKDGFFSKQIIWFLAGNYIPAMFGFHRDEKLEREKVEWLAGQREKLAKNTAKIFGNDFKEIADQMYEQMAEKQGNVREALRIKTIYNNVDAVQKSMIDNAQENIEKKMAEGELDLLYSAFSDIYSDIFAICILGIHNAKEYLQIIPEILGSEMDEIPQGLPSLFRVLVVVDALWPDQDKKEIWDWMSNADTTIRSRLIQQWKEFENVSYLCYLKEYAKRCKEEMDRQVEEAESKSDEEKKALSNMRGIFNDDPEQQISAVYYFCKYLMKGEISDESHKQA